MAGGSWPDYLECWLERVEAKGRYVAVEGVVVALDQMSAREYVESDRLDLDHLSRARPLEPKTGEATEPGAVQ